MQSSDLTKFKFAANIAGPYCSACSSGGGGSAGPAGPPGPTGPTGPSGGGTPTTWAQYPATSNVDISCNLINDVSGINFCDGLAYIGPGGSFDISSSQDIDVITSGANKSVSLIGNFTAPPPGGNFGSGAKLEVGTDISDGKILLAAQYPGPSRERGSMIKMTKRADVFSNVIISANVNSDFVGVNSALVQTEDRTVIVSASTPKLDFNSTLEPDLNIPATLEYDIGNATLQANISQFNIGSGTEILSLGFNGTNHTINSGFPLNIESANDITLDAPSGLINVPGTLKPAQIADPLGATGNPGDYLAKDGAGTLTWVNIPPNPSSWQGTATSDLDMNGYKIILTGDASLGSPAKIEFTDTVTPTTANIVMSSNSDPTLECSCRIFRLFTGANAIISMIANETSGENSIYAEGGDLQLKTNSGAITGTVDVAGTLKQFEFGSANAVFSYLTPDGSVVNIDEGGQIPTNTIAAPMYERNVVVGGTTISNTNPPSAPIFTSNNFKWKYGGDGFLYTDSKFCTAQTVEVEVDISLLGTLAGNFQFAVSLNNITMGTTILPDNYVGASGSTPFNGLQPSTTYTKTQFGQEAVFIKFSSTFAVSGNFKDGDTISVDIWVISDVSGPPYTINDGRVTTKIRPLSQWV